MAITLRARTRRHHTVHAHTHKKASIWKTGNFLITRDPGFHVKQTSVIKDQRWDTICEKRHFLPLNDGTASSRKEDGRLQLFVAGTPSSYLTAQIVSSTPSCPQLGREFVSRLLSFDYGGTMELQLKQRASPLIFDLYVCPPNVQTHTRTRAHLFFPCLTRKRVPKLIRSSKKAKPCRTHDANYY